MKTFASHKGSDRVGVCVATYNAHAFITATLDCILAQTFGNFRVFISDDASSDDTVEICRRYASADPRVSIHAHSRRLGWVGNVNRALEAAAGEYLMIISHDDLIHPDYIGSLVEALERNPRASLAFSDMIEHTLEGEQRLLAFKACDAVASPTERAVRIISWRSPWWTCYRGLFRYSVYESIGGLRTHWGGEFSADMPWVLRLAIAGEFVRVPRALYYKHRRSSSLAKSWKYSAGYRLAVLFACSRAVSEAGLPTAQAYPVYLAICRRMIELLKGDFRRRLRRYQQRARSLVSRT